MKEIKNIKTLTLTPDSFSDKCFKIELDFPDGIEIGIRKFDLNDEEFEPIEPSFDYEEQVEYIVKNTGLNKEHVEMILDAEMDFLVEKGIAIIPKEQK